MRCRLYDAVKGRGLSLERDAREYGGAQFALAQREVAVNDTIKLVAETEAGAIYHDEQNDEWLVDVASKGITLYFDQEEFQEFLELLRAVRDYSWDIKAEPRRSA